MNEIIDDYRHINSIFSDPDNASYGSESLRFRSFEKKRIGSNAQKIRRGKLSGSENISYDLRKFKASTNGTIVEYIACPMCGLNRPRKTITRLGRDLSEPFQPFTDRILQDRIGGGRGTGFFLHQGYNLNHIYENEPQLFENIKQTAQELYNLCMEIENNESE